MINVLYWLHPVICCIIGMLSVIFARKYTNTTFKKVVCIILFDVTAVILLNVIYHAVGIPLSSNLMF